MTHESQNSLFTKALCTNIYDIADLREKHGPESNEYNSTISALQGYYQQNLSVYLGDAVTFVRNYNPDSAPTVPTSTAMGILLALAPTPDLGQVDETGLTQTGHKPDAIKYIAEDYAHFLQSLNFVSRSQTQDTGMKNLQRTALELEIAALSQPVPLRSIHTQPKV